MWSIANEAATYSKGSHEYFEPLFNLARESDPKKCRLTYINIMMATPKAENVQTKRM